MDVILFILVLALTATGIVSCTNTLTCDAIAGKMELNSSYSVLTGCMVGKDGKWAPLKSLHHNLEE